jgi:hypothetical protein
MLWKILLYLISGRKRFFRNRQFEIIDHSNYVMPDLGSGEVKLVFVASPLPGVDRGRLEYSENAIRITNTKRNSSSIVIEGERRIEFLMFALIEAVRNMKENKKRKKKEKSALKKTA